MATQVFESRIIKNFGIPARMRAYRSADRLNEAYKLNKLSKNDAVEINVVGSKKTMANLRSAIYYYSRKQGIGLTSRVIGNKLYVIRIK